MRAGDLLTIDFGIPIGSEPGFVRPTVLVTADEYLAGQPSTFQVVPVTSNVGRDYASDVPIPGLAQSSVAQCRLVTTISPVRLVDGDLGNVGAVLLQQIRSVLADLLDIPGTD